MIATLPIVSGGACARPPRSMGLSREQGTARAFGVVLLIDPLKAS